MTTAAIFFEPDGYVLNSPKLMGRQAAGHAFLRAAVAAHEGAPLYAYTPQRGSAQVMAQLAKEIDPAASAQWIPADRLDLLSQVGTLYLPGPGLAPAAQLRLRAGAAAYSLVGVTHTTASHGAMDAIAGLLSAPVMPWDALICTSAAVASTVQVVLQAELDQLRWRFGPSLRVTLPQLPVIPLGVHCVDFVFDDAERAAARSALGIATDEVVVLFVGRLSFHAKAHPHAMYAGLQVAAERSGKAVTLLQCGWFSNQAIEDSFTDGAVQFCPGVRAMFTDGREAEVRRRCWAAADVFVSLSDNLQETFGLTPVEAMAAGLPVVVSDWNGYKDTVRDGVDGYRIPTWMPPPDLGEPLARAHEAGVDNYDMYCGLTCQTVSLDGCALAQRLSELVCDAGLRRRLGANGKARAREVYDWPVVYRQYRTLWGQLAELRCAALADPGWQQQLQAAPRQAPARLDPYRSFGHYPSATILPQTRAQALPEATLAAYQQYAAHALYSYAVKVLPQPALVDRLLALLSGAGLSMAALAEQVGVDCGSVIMAVAVLAKMGLVRLLPPAI